MSLYLADYYLPLPSYHGYLPPAQNLLPRNWTYGPLSIPPPTSPVLQPVKQPSIFTIDSILGNADSECKTTAFESHTAHPSAVHPSKNFAPPKYSASIPEIYSCINALKQLPNYEIDHVLNDSNHLVLPRNCPPFYAGKNRHMCPYCGKLYSRKYGLKIHLRTHTGFKPLKCKVCERPFGDPSNLNKHVRLHTESENAPYKCGQCGKILVRRRDLERHVKSRHPGCSNPSDLRSGPAGESDPACFLGTGGKPAKSNDVRVS